MSDRVAVAAAARRRLTGVDPARAWAYVADFRNMADWTGAVEVEWDGDVASTGDRVASIHRLVVVRYRVEAEVTAWEAGRAFTLRLEGLPAALDAEVSCSIETFVEQGQPAAAAELRFRGTARRRLAPAVRRQAARRLERALSKLERKLR